MVPGATALAGPAPVSAGGHAVRELQLNLCNSGRAECYRNGRSVDEAAQLITRYQPTLVTLNEICAANVLGAGAAIPAAMAGVARRAGDSAVFALFAPAINANTHSPYKCVNGDSYGIGMVGLGSVTGSARHTYRNQYRETDEWRVALCAAIAAGYDVCATHLESDNRAVALDQCRELLGGGGEVSRFQRATGDRPTIVGGDFNLVTGGRPDARDCLPAGWLGTDDGAVQHVLATRDFVLRGTRTITMRYTDHPAFVVDFGYQVD